MKTIKIFGIRVLFIITCILVALTLSCNTDKSEFGAILLLLCYTGLSIYILWRILHNKTENEIKNILGISWVENKININFTEE